MSSCVNASAIAGMSCKRDRRQSELKTHLRVAHEVAILFAVVTYRDSGKPTRAGFVGCFDYQRHVGRVLDLEVKAVVPTSGLFEDAKNGLHQATFASSASGIASASVLLLLALSSTGDYNAARMTAEVCCTTSKLSARSEALPW